MKYEKILKKLTDNYDKKKILEAYEFASTAHEKKFRENGEKYITHPLEVAEILVDMKASEELVICALIHETINHGCMTMDDIFKKFSPHVASITKQITKINLLGLENQKINEAEHLKKILVGISKDADVLYIKLVDRLANLRSNLNMPGYEKKIKADETLKIFVPIAHRLGLWEIKTELENLSLLYLEPKIYNDIESKLKKTEKESLDEAKEYIINLLKEKEINFEIKGRVKSIYSIFKKIEKGRDWDDIYDILALRIYVNTNEECYKVLSIIHQNFFVIIKRFKDFISKPKTNNYQSIHTSVKRNEKIFEIQIRTYEMDKVAERGIASHWSYKENNSKSSYFDQKLEMFRNLIEKHAEEKEVLEDEILGDIIYVSTPKEDIVELPIGATPIDFAYRIHTEIGNHITGAIVNEKIEKLNYQLKNNDIVKIKTSEKAMPKEQWLNMVKTAHAKNKIKSYFSKEITENEIESGKKLIEKELIKRKIKKNSLNITKILKDLKINTEDELYHQVGALRYTASYIVTLSSENKKKLADLHIKKTKRVIETKKIIIDGHKNVNVTLAKCCNPLYNDDIVGNITINNGIVVHKKNCENINKEEKKVKAAWE